MTPRIISSLTNEIKMLKNKMTNKNTKYFSTYFICNVSDQDMAMEKDQDIGLGTLIYQLEEESYIYEM